ncbi:MAG: ATP-grasp domain-containing protein [Clostridia bacterium]|nr:ATP-grasp domain-containing protein [Clostridia bacterium]
MLRIGIIYGGNSTEHDVSILTGLHLAKHVTEAYQVTLIYLTRDNRIVHGSRKIDDYISGKAAKAKKFKQWQKLACVVNCCHGGVGEDGTLAAVLRFYNIPITSCSSVSGWLQQSKIATRQVLTAAGFLQPRFQILNSSADLSLVELPLPLVVKPDLQGSSIGISIARTKDELRTAVDTAFSLGERVIVEEYIADMREVNVAVMREQNKIITSALEIVGGEKFFSFEEKYFNADSGFIKKGGQNPDDEFLNKIEKQIKFLAERAYELFNASGVVRVDFMVRGEEVILNEINTVPGFMAYHLWLKARVPYGVVIDNLVQEAIANHQKKQQFITYYDSKILAKNRHLVVEF